MKDLDLAIFTFIGLIFCAPFIFEMLLISFFGYEQDKTWSLIILGMATCGLPISALGGFKILKVLGNDEQKVGSVE